MAETPQLGDCKGMAQVEAKF